MNAKLPSVKPKAQNLYAVGRKSRKVLFYIARGLCIFGLCYLFLFPLLYMFSAAFQSPESLVDPSVIWIPKKLSLSAFKEVLRLLNYGNSVWLTIKIAVPSTIFTMISCSMAGYSFSRFRYKGRNLLFALVVLMIVIPPQAILVSSYLNFRFFDFGGILKLFGTSVDLLNTVWVFILPSMFASGLRAGLFIFIFRQFFSGLPRELEEAAHIDGCKTFSTFWRVIVPTSKAAFITVGLFSFIWHWNDLYSSAMYFTGEIRPVMATLNDLGDIMAVGDLINWNTSMYTVRSYFAAGSLVTVAPPLIIYIIFQRFFTESIERSGIVG